MKFVETIEALEALYDTPGDTSLRKVAPHLSRNYSDWIARSRFCILATVGPEGTDISPRGDVDPVVRQLDAQHLALPDWAGNNRIDTLRNIVRDPRISLMFMVPGSNNVIRVNGSARISIQGDLLATFERKGVRPRSVIVVKITEVYSQCARAILRAGLWNSGDQSEGLPSMGEILSELTDGEIGGPDYDREWAPRAALTMW